MKHIATKYTLVYLLLCLFCLPIFGQGTDLFYNELSGKDIAKNKSFMVTDDRFRDKSWKDIQKNYAVKSYVALSVNDDTPIVVNDPFICVVKLRIDQWNSADDSTSFTKEMTLSYDPSGKEDFIARDEIKFDQAHEYRVTITDIETKDKGGKPIDLPAILKLTGYLQIERSLFFNCEQQLGIDAESSNNDRLRIFWSMLDPGVEYELEWTFYDRESVWGQAIANNTGINLDDYNEIFKDNASRLITSQSTFELPLVFPNGYIFYRVRGAHFLDGLRQNTAWSHGSSGNLIDFQNRYAVEQAHQSNLNWQTTSTFAEDGRNVQSVTYADGLPRARQEMSLSRADDIVIVSEKIYDLHGRPVMQIMPTPSHNYPNNFGYIPDFSIHNGNHYNASNFDLGSDCDIFTVDPMSKTHGASWYYSGNNSKANDPLSVHRFIPDAEEYPFAVTEYTPDATGRIKRQGGVGLTFKSNGTHATNYFYGTASQGELNRLFDTDDVGKSVHYQKNMAKDPNGQYSVSYVDANGRTIATALAGEVPENLTALESWPQASTINTDLLNNILKDATKVSSYNLLVTDEGNYNFNYNTQGLNYTEPCLVASNQCYDCLYDLTITVSDNCGGSTSPLHQIVRPNTKLFDGTCDPATHGLSEVFDLTLPPGEYTVSKKVSVSLQSVEKYAELYQANNTCMPVLSELTTSFLTQYLDPNCGLSCKDCLGAVRDWGVANMVPPTSPEYLALVAECDCDDEEPTNQCAIYYETLLMDVSPLGQYMQLEEDCTTTDPASFFFITNNDPATAKYKSPGAGNPYLDEDGNQDFVTIQGVPYKPEVLDACDFIANWNPSWAKTLIKLHPEYCLYLACHDQILSVRFDSLLLRVPEVGNTSYLANNGEGIVNQDPFFNSPQGMPFKQDMLDYMTEFATDGTTTYSLIEMIIASIACESELPCTTTYASLCSTDKKRFWTIFKASYLGRKYAFFSKYINDTQCGNSECVEVTPACPAPNNIYATKTKRWIVKNPVPVGSNIQQLNAQYEAEAQAGIMENCAINCEGTVHAWILKLQESPCVANLSVDEIEILRGLLMTICTESCDETHIYGATNAPGYTGGPNTIRAALEQVLNISISDCDEVCNDLFVTFPGTSENPQFPIDYSQYFPLAQNECFCTNLEKFQDCHAALPPGSISFLDYFNSFSDVKITPAGLSQIISFCPSNLGCNFIDPNLIVPPQLNCGVCKTYLEVAESLSAMGCSNASPVLKAAFLNRTLGLNLEWFEYEAFINYHLNTTDPQVCKDASILCPRSPAPPVAYEDCQVVQEEILTSAAEDAYWSEIYDRTEAFKRNYLSHCINQLEETFTTNAGLREHHYTLYYYDRAGFLTQTVPPNGVSAGTPGGHTFKTNYRYDCFGNQIEQTTPDGGVTRTWYDYLGRPVASQDARQAESTPNLYSYTLYDGLSRPIETGEKVPVSGLLEDYMALDPVLFRAWLDENATSTRTDVTRSYYDDAPIQIPNFAPENLRKRIAAVVFMDHYVDPMNPLTASDYQFATHYSYDIAGNVNTLIQDIQELELGSNSTNRYKRIDYEYDIVSGKVNRVVYQQDQRDQFIHQYTYDDNNRLLKTETSTTGTPGSWEIDAEYQYYLHGPLARTILGERKVQGTDYAHTLQGWIKGVNASAMTPFLDDSDLPEFLHLDDDPIQDGLYKARIGIYSQGKVPDGGNVEMLAGKFVKLEESTFKAESHFKANVDPSLLITGPQPDIVDMGRDGTPENHLIARDAMAYTLGYFNEDYKKVSINNANAPNFEVSQLYPGFQAASPSLYNGNIRHIAQQVKTLTASGFVYRYDQLSRLLEMDYWRRPNGGTWGGTDAYKERVSYDPNGNILTYLRHAADAQGNDVGMDNLTYQYQSGGNRLRHVTDAVSNSSFPDDIESQGVDNYEYDGSGNLKHDASKGAGFRWSMYGKLKHVEGLPNDVNLYYRYDAMQKRVVKTVTKAGIETKTFYVYDAQGNAMATYELKDIAGTSTLRLRELDLYGSARLGIYKPNATMWRANTGDTGGGPLSPNYTNKKEYELSNHLGNVLATITDMRDGVDMDNNGIAEYYEPRMASAREYYPFGMLMPNRKTPTFGNSKYRYGFNGKEADDEVYGDDQFQDYGMRIYNAGLGKFLSVDPIARQYPELTPYQFASNTPIQAVDLDGLEKYYAADGTYINAVGADTEIRVVTDENLANAKKYIEWANYNLSRPFEIENILNLPYNTAQAKKYSTSLKDYASVKSDVTNGATPRLWADYDNCNKAALAQMDDAGITPLSKFEAIQTDVDNSRQPDDNQLTENKIGGAIYIITEIKKGNPVMVGLKETLLDGSVVNIADDGMTPNHNQNTAHFVVINAISHNGQYIDFQYIDNASSSCVTDTGNKLNLGLTNGRLVNGNDPCNRNIDEYEVTEVRKNK